MQGEHRFDINFELDFPSEKLARMAGMTAPLPDTPSRKAKTWEQVNKTMPLTYYLKSVVIREYQESNDA